jgi:hypothetical protein
VSALLSPDCRDGNHFKCDGVAWNLQTDEPGQCECDGNCADPAPADAFTVYPHTMDAGHDCIIDGEGTIRMLWELDALAWNKSLTEAELAAEHFAAVAVSAQLDVHAILAGEGPAADAFSNKSELELECAEVFERFASLPHHDELP